MCSMLGLLKVLVPHCVGGQVVLDKWVSLKAVPWSRPTIWEKVLIL